MRSTRWRTWHAAAIGACLGIVVFMVAHGFYGMEANPAEAFRQLLAMSCGGALLGGAIGIIIMLWRRPQQ